MADLIDREYLQKALSAFCDVEHGNKHFLAGISAAREIIGTAPTIDLVHCNECLHWGRNLPGETDYIKVCGLTNWILGTHGYCLYGERRNNGRHD